LLVYGRSAPMNSNCADGCSPATATAASTY
jgi:hypothetical protein